MLRTPMDEMRNKTFVLIAQLAGDKEDRDNKLRRMSDELKKLKDNLARQERMEDEVCFNIPKTGLWLENVISMPLARIYWIVTVKKRSNWDIRVFRVKLFPEIRCWSLQRTWRGGLLLNQAFNSPGWFSLIFKSLQLIWLHLSFFRCGTILRATNI